MTSDYSFKMANKCSIKIKQMDYTIAHKEPQVF